MKKTNFTFLKGLALSALMMLGFANANAQGLACQDHINASLSATCTVDLAAVVTAAGGVSITVKDGNTPLANGGTAVFGTASANGSVVINRIYTYEIMGAAGNKCWGTIKFEDKLAPSITCPAAVTVACDQDYKFSPSELEIITTGTATAGQILSSAITTGLPAVTECSAFKLYYSDSKTLACGAGTVGSVVRTFRATDVYGNTTSCTQAMTIAGRGTNNVPFIAAPADVTVTICKADINLSNFTPAAMAVSTVTAIKNAAYPVGVGNPNANDCMVSATYTDKVTNDPCGNKIVRTWVIVNMCTGAIITDPTDAIQVITLTDNLAPSFVNATLPDITITTSAINCLSDQEVPFPAVTDNCALATGTMRVAGITHHVTLGGGKMLPPPNRHVRIRVLATSNTPYVATWTVIDECGNAATKTQNITVQDLVPPVAVADQNTNVSLTLDCTATVNATTFDDGSLDNCCLDVNRFEVARMTGTTVGTYGPTVTFTKADLTDGCTGNVMVAFRVWDCNGNSNVAMVNVKVEDKIGPVAAGKDTNVVCGNTALGTQWLESWNARFKALSTLQYPPVSGTNPGYFDNCDATVSWGNISGTIDQCGIGGVSRTATVKDACGRTATANFAYNSTHASEFRITLPANLKATCPGSSVPTKADAIAAAKATLATISGCPVVAVDIKSEEIFTAVTGACYRIKRTWVVTSLCHSGMMRGDWINTKGTKRSATEDTPVMADATAYVYTSEGDDKYVEYVQVIDVNDTEAPTITNEQTPVLVADGKCGLKMTVGGFDATDGCAASVAKSWVLLDANKQVVTGALAGGGSTFPATYTFTTSQFGNTYFVRYRAADNCGNIAIKDFEVKPRDIIKPTPVCYQGLSVDLMPTTGEVWLSATMFDAGSSDGCLVDVTGKTIPGLTPGANPAPSTYARMTSKDKSVVLRIERGTPGFGSGVPATNMIWVGCVGIVPIRIWAIDAAGNADYCDTYVDVQNNMGATPKEGGNCPSVTVTGTKSVAGTITTANNKALENTKVTVVSSTAANNLNSNVVGGNFSAIVGAGSDVKISVDKNDNPLNGVSTFDLVLISKHILNTQPINGKYELIAADVNNNGKVTTSDVVELRKMILGIQNNFNNNKSWRFFDASMNEEVAIQNIQNNATVNFTAVKVGDVNGNANAASAPRSTYTFVADDKNVAAGELVTLTLNGTEGFGFTMNYDAKSLEVVSVDENSAVIENGTITTAQVGSEFKVAFKATTNVTMSEAIAINSNVTTAEAVVNGEATNVALKFNNKVAGFELFQNQPNPFRGATTISFNAANAGDYTITVTDVAGRTVKSVAGAAVKGLNNVTVEMNNAGVYNYTVTTGNFTATKKMVVIE